MSDRFYCPELNADNPVRLQGAEAHHLLRVLRKTVGEIVELFDGSGGSAAAEITAVSKKTADLKILNIKEAPPSVGEIVLASSVPKGDRFRWLIEKAAELGVDRFIPLLADRSVVNPGQGKREKMEQAVIEACKQCRRNRLMRIEEPQSFAAVLATVPAKHQFACLADPSGQTLRQAFPQNRRDDILIFIGPEGGWTEEELAQATGAGVITVSLGTNILRIETAAIALAAFASLTRLGSARERPA